MENSRHCGVKRGRLFNRENQRVPLRMFHNADSFNFGRRLALQFVACVRPDGMTL
jgi:hypothetical protein